MEDRIRVGLERKALARWPDDKTRFWQLDMGLDEKLLNGLVSDVSRALFGFAQVPDRVVVAVLMQVLRSHLPNVRQSRLWPDVAQYFSLHSGVKRPVDEYAQRFRSRLDAVFRSRLSGIPEFRRYVCLLLDEAGIGYDRAHIIIDFLAQVAELDIRQELTDGTLEEYVSKTLNRFVADRGNRTDIEALQLVLARAGMTLARIRLVLHDEADPWELQLWGWEDLRDFWLDRAQEDLSLLIPEAREVFEALIPQLSGTLFVDQVFALAQSGKYQLSIGGASIKPGSWSSADEVPLGAVEIVSGAVSRHVRVIDSFGLSAATLDNCSPDVWYRRGPKGYFIWMHRPFEVVLDDRWAKRARPVAGPEPGNPPCYLWSGFVRPGQSAWVDVPRIVLKRDPDAWPLFHWKYFDSGPVICVSGIGFLNFPNSDRATARIGDEIVWTGRIGKASGSLRCRNEIKFQPNSALTGVVFELALEGGVSVVKDLALPALPFGIQDEMVVSGDRLARGVIVRKNLAGTILVGPASASPPRTFNCTVRTPQRHTLPAGTAAWVVQADPHIGNGRSLRVLWCERIWDEGAARPRLELVVPPSPGISEIDLQATGNLQMIREGAESSAFLRASHLREDGEYKLEVSLLGGRWVLTLADNPAIMGIGDILDKLPARFAGMLAGLLRFQLLEHGKETGNPEFAFLTGTAIELEAARKGLPSRLIIGSARWGDLLVVSDDPVQEDGQSVSATLLFPYEKGLSGADGISVIWKALCRDLVVLLDEEELGSGPLTVEDLKRLKFQLIGKGTSISIGFFAGKEAILSGVDPLTCPSGRKLVQRLFDSGAGTGLDDTDILEIRIQDKTESLRSITVDPSSLVTSISATVTYDGMVPVLRCELSWTGLPFFSRELELNSVFLPSPRAVRVKADEEDYLDMSGEFEIPLPEFEGYTTLAEIPLDVKFLESGREIRSVSLRFRPSLEQEDPVVLRNRLKAILDNRQPAHDGVAIEHVSGVVGLIERYLALTGEFPFATDRLEEALNRLASGIKGGGKYVLLFGVRRELMESPGVPHSRPNPGKTLGIDDVLANVLLVHVLARECRKGTADPKQIRALNEALDAQLKALSGSALEGVVLLLRRICEKLSGEEYPSTEHNFSAREEPDLTAHRVFYIDPEVFGMYSGNRLSG